jgi:hypothetical protein
MGENAKDNWDVLDKAHQDWTIIHLNKLRFMLLFMMIIHQLLPYIMELNCVDNTQSII